MARMQATAWLTSVADLGFLVGLIGLLPGLPGGALLGALLGPLLGASLGELPTASTTALMRSNHGFEGIGGGEIARDELLATGRAGKPVTFIPAEMNHELARERARRMGQPQPKESDGASALAV
jgi:hypothetical protein